MTPAPNYLQSRANRTTRRQMQDRIRCISGLVQDLKSMAEAYEMYGVLDLAAKLENHCVRARDELKSARAPRRRRGARQETR